MPGKILGPKLWAKMLPANQIAGFCNHEVYFLHVDKYGSLLQVDTIIWLGVTRHVQSTQNKFAYLCSISIKTWGMKLIFCLQINTKVFY